MRLRRLLTALLCAALLAGLAAFPAAPAGIASGHPGPAQAGPDPAGPGPAGPVLAGPVLAGWLEPGEVHGHGLHLAGGQLTVRVLRPGPGLLVELRSAAGDVRVAGRVGDAASPRDGFSAGGLAPGPYVLAVSPLGGTRGEYALELGGDGVGAPAPLPLFTGVPPGARWVRATGRFRWSFAPAGVPAGGAPAGGAPPAGSPAHWQLSLSVAPRTWLEQSGLPGTLELDTRDLGEGLHSAAVTVRAGASYVSRPIQLLVDNLAAFADVPDEHWARAEIEVGTELGLTRGYPGGRFDPDRPVTRAELVKLLVTAAGVGLAPPPTPSFADVPAAHWAYSYVEAARTAGIALGEPAGARPRFAPHRPVSRAEAAVMLARAAALPLTGGTLPFADAAAVPSWAMPAVGAVHQAGLMAGFPDGRFAPNDPVTRAQAAAIALRIMD